MSNENELRKKETMLIRHAWFDGLQIMGATLEQAGNFILALMEYESCGKVPDFKGDKMLDGAWKIIH
jgi:hypothetical protein